jgi:tetratricopeptide (TPR) repeat protein
LAVIAANQALYGDRPYAEAMGEARRHVERALEYDPGFANAHAILARIIVAAEGDYAAAVEELQRAIELAPGSAPVLGNSAAVLMLIGRFDQAISLQERGLALDPVSPIASFNLAKRYLAAGRAEAAEAAARDALLLSPGYSGGHFLLGRALLLQGRAEEALVAFEEEPREAMRLAGLGVAEHELGRPDRSDAALTGLVAIAGEDPASAACLVASVHAWREEPDEAFAWLDRAYEAGGGGALRESRSEVLLHNLHSDARWQELLARAGLSDAQLASIEFEIPAESD